jgi:hypothetical protein
VEISFVENPHDRGETPFSSRVLGRHRPFLPSLLSFLEGHSRLTVRVNFPRDRREVPPLLVGLPRGDLNVLAYFFRRNSFSLLLPLGKVLKSAVVSYRSPRTGGSWQLERIRERQARNLFSNLNSGSDSQWPDKL